MSLAEFAQSAKNSNPFFRRHVRRKNSLRRSVTRALAPTNRRAMEREYFKGEPQKIEFRTLHNPIEYIGDEKGRVKQMLLQKMELGEPDASGRRKPVAIEGATELIDVDTVIVSVGVSPNPLIPRSIDGLEVSKKGTIVVGDNMQSSIPMIFAGGDIVRGGATVILAMGDGRKAAAEMDAYLKK